ncbi:peptidase [Streptomyces sp. NBC_00572]|uniref:peptidase n=1 Tax=Streptomyces sp. NBC_00572 TaxID=2903664 RepID=UPI00225621B2|nr:peptidase [Streptomyces sp. NBC_00572]MCX4981280.1 peptidase [Streptomyces sp. NBC_00572]
MSKEPNRRRTTAALTAAVAVAGAAVLAGAPAAQAAVVDVNYACETKIGPKGAVSPVDIKAVKNGSAYTITMSFEKGVSDSPIELPKGVMTPRAELVLGGADSGTVKVKGTPNTAAIPPDTPIKIGTLTGTYTPKKNGKVTFTAGTLTVHALGMDAAVCTPKNNPKPALELEVTGLSGGADTPPPADDGEDQGTELPKTGPLDSAMALGTLGGTVLLTGAAGVLWLTRRTAR